MGWMWATKTSGSRSATPCDDRSRKDDTPVSGFDATAKKLKALAEEYEVHEIVVGNPHAHGRTSEPSGREGDEVRPKAR
jgi:RNase H-fold protein (predicted Holliday junction resolvase)